MANSENLSTGQRPAERIFGKLFQQKEMTMSDAHHDHHEDNSINVKVGIIFVAVLAAIILIGLL